MATLPKESTFTPAPSGTHPAICYQVIDLGTQDTVYMNKITRKHQIRITWELLCDDRMQDGRRYSVSRKYKWSMWKKAPLRLDLEMWRGKPFADSDMGPGGFDIKNILTAPCLVTVKHEEKAGDVYANVAGVTSLPKGMIVGKLETPTLYLWLSHEEFDKDAFMKLSEKMRIIIAKAPEYKAVLTGEDVDIEGLDPGGHDSYDMDPSDDIPF
jgi:hypothetical protein